MSKISIMQDVAFVINRAHLMGVDEISPILAMAWVNLVRFNNERKELNILQITDAFSRLKNKNFINVACKDYSNLWFQLFSINLDNKKNFIKYINKRK